jgi:hypothetical protein
MKLFAKSETGIATPLEVIRDFNVKSSPEILSKEAILKIRPKRAVTAKMAN